MGFTFKTTPQIRFERNGAANIGALVKSRMSRPLFVTDKDILKFGLAETAFNSLKEAGVEFEVFDGVVADPPEAVIKEAVEFAKTHNTDGVIGLGGGSSLDTAKLIAVLLKGKQSLHDIFGVDQVEGDRLPLILLPTTAGTGSEVTAISIVTTEDDRKVGIVSDQLYADVAIVDPVLTMTAPRKVTAATGIDAMVHAIEAHTSVRLRNPLSSTLAKQALQLMSANLIKACDTPDDIEAREAMCIGATLAGQAFANAPVGAVHAMAYPLGALFHVPHGVSNALMLSPVLKFNCEKAAEQYAELGPYVGVKADADAFVEKMIDLCKQSGVPLKLRDVGVNHNDLPRMAEDVIANTRLMQNNPREMSYEQALSLYQEVL